MTDPNLKGPLKDLLLTVGRVAAKAAGEAVVAGADSLLGDAEDASRSVVDVIGHLRNAMRERAARRPPR
jgi:hypothetical protein